MNILVNIELALKSNYWLFITKLNSHKNKKLTISN